MFDSGITAQTLISALKTEADIAPDIPDSYFVDWLNEVEQTLYDNIIREVEVINKRLEEMVNNGDHSISTGEFSILYSVLNDKRGDAVNSKDITRYEDILDILIGGRQLTKISVSAWEKLLFPYSCCKGLDRIKMYLPVFSNDSQWRDLRVKISFQVRPLPVVVNAIDQTYANPAVHRVSVPVEFIDMVRAKMRGEAYKFANEDALAAKWLADYNAQLEYFRAWIASKSPTFGV